MTVRRVVTVLVALGAALSAQAFGLTVPAAAAEEATTDHVVVVGVPGLRWADVGADSTPAIWQVAERGAIGSLSVRSGRSRTCPSDGWVQLGTGNRARGGEPDADGRCGPLPPETRVSGEPLAGRVATWSALVEDNERLLFDTVLGLMGEEVDGCVAASGPGAVVGGADTQGVVDRWVPDTQRLTADLMAECDLTVVGSDAFLSGERSPETVAEVDALVRRVDAARPDGSLLLLVGLSEVADEPRQLHVAVADGPGYEGGLLVSSSTRREPFVQLSDVAPTVLTALGLAVPDDMPYQPWRVSDVDRSADLQTEVDRLVDLDVHAQRMLESVAGFFLVIVLLQIVFYAGAYVVLRREPGTKVRGSVLVGTQVVALLAAAGVVATYLANLVPWWRSEHPLVALLGAVLGFAVAMVAIAYAGPWRRHPFGPAGAVAALSVLVMTVDIVTGARLQLSSLAGYSPIVAGRFAGFGNIAYAVFGTSALLATAAAVSGRSRRTTLWVVGVAGLAAVVLDGAPQWGSDFGGVIALVPAFAVLGILASGMRLSWRRLAAVLVAGVVVVAVVSTLDWLRPEDDRTHLGRFVADLLDGDAWTVVQRKLDANLSLLRASVLTWIVPLAIVFVWFLLRRPRGLLLRAFDRVPTLYAGLVSVLVLGVVGGLVNDSGIAVPAMAAVVSIPLAVAVVARVLRDELPSSLEGGRGGPAPAVSDAMDPPVVATPQRPVGDTPG